MIYFKKEVKFCTKRTKYEMNDQEFYKSFTFNEFKRRGTTTVDNTRGIGVHFIAYMKKGRAILTSSDTRIEVKAGDMFYLPKNILVSYNSKCDNPYEYFWVGFDGDGVEKLINDIGVSQTMPIKSYCDAKITTIFDSMKNEVEKYSEIC